MKSTQLSPDEQRLLGEVSLVARYGDNERSPVRPEQIIEPRRREDVDRSLWTTFNVIQENVVRGGLQGRKRLARAVSAERRPRDQRHRPECDAQPCALDAGRRDAAPQSGVTITTAGPEFPALRLRHFRADPLPWIGGGRASQGPRGHLWRARQGNAQLAILKRDVG